MKYSMNNAITQIDTYVNTINYRVQSSQKQVEQLKTVYNHLGRWADDATIGKDVKDCIKKINDGMDALFEITNNLMDSIQSFNEQQKRLNNITVLRSSNGSNFTIYNSSGPVKSVR